MNAPDFLRMLLRRVMLTVGRGTLQLTDDDSGQQRMQVSLLDGEIRAEADRMQQYGLSSHPQAGSSVVVVCVGGDRGHPVIIAADDPRARPTALKAGEVAVYSAAGQRILLREDRGLEITTQDGAKIEIGPDQVVTVEALQLVVKAAEKARFETPRMEVTGALVAASLTEGAV